MSSYRMQTRASNSTTHPGKRAADALRVRRPREVVQREKDEKRAKQDKNEAMEVLKEVRREAGKHYIAALEAKVAAEAVENESRYPRHQVETSKSKPNKDQSAYLKVDLQEQAQRRAADKRTLPDTMRSAPKRNYAEFDPAMLNDDSMDGMIRIGPPSSKRPKPLRRTETCLEDVILNDARNPSPGDDVVMASSPLVAEMDGDEDEESDENTTPRPHKRVQIDEEAFKMPLTLTWNAKNMKHRATEDAVEDEPEHGPIVYEEGERRKSISRYGTSNVGNVDFAGNDADAESALTVHRHDKKASDADAESVHIVRNHGKKASQAKPRSVENADVDSDPDIEANHIVRHHDKASRGSAKPRSVQNADVAGNDADAESALTVHRHDKKASQASAKQRTTSSNSSVAANNPKVKAQPTEEHTDGSDDDEDDSVERDVAMSSPIKGGEYRKSVKTLVKTREPNRKQRPAIGRLPDGATDDNAWTRVVILTFINLVLSGDKPWISSEAELGPLLQDVWDHTYGDNLPFDIKKSTVPFELAVQKLCQYRNNFAAKAFSVIYNYFISMNPDVEEDEVEELIARFSEVLCENNNFIYKGMETNKAKRNGTFQHMLVIQTFSAHFSKLTVTTAPPLKGITIGKPYCGLALAVAALERALRLFMKRVVAVEIVKTGAKFTVSKLINPDTNRESTNATDFSFAVWGEATDDYLVAIKKYKKTFPDIFDAALRTTRRAVKYKEAIASATHARIRSFRADLHSESDDSEPEDLNDKGEGPSGLNA